MDFHESLFCGIGGFDDSTETRLRNMCLCLVEKVPKIVSQMVFVLMIYYGKIDFKQIQVDKLELVGKEIPQPGSDI